MLSSELFHNGSLVCGLCSTSRTIASVKCLDMALVFEGDTLEQRPQHMCAAMPAGTLLAIVMIAVYLAAGGLELSLNAVYDSYGLWPVERLMPGPARPST